MISVAEKDALAEKWYFTYVHYLVETSMYRDNS